MADYTDDYQRSGYAGPIPPVNEGRKVLGQIDSDGTFHQVIVGKSYGNVLSTEEVRVTDPDTGGQKGMKPERHSLVPLKAVGMIARVYNYGAQKYAAHNWRKGYDWSLSYDACRRHLDAFWEGENLDPESGLPHLAHAGFHILTMLTFLLDKRYAAKDDRYKP